MNTTVPSLKKLSLIAAMFLLAGTLGVLSALGGVEFLALFTFLYLTIFLLFNVFVKEGKTLYLLCFITLSSLFLLPSFQVGGIELRVEDYVAVFAGLLFLVKLYNDEVLGIPVVKWIIAYAVYCAAVTMGGLVFGELSPTHTLFFVKEVQYFFYFFLFYYIVTRYPLEFKIIRLFFWLSIATIVWGVYQLATGNLIGYYGIGLIGETASSQSGGTFFLITLFMIYLYTTSQNTMHRLLTFSLILLSFGLTLATVSRTSILALSFTVALYVLYSIISLRFKPRTLIIFLYISVTVVPLVYLTLGQFGNYIAARLNGIDRGVGSRTSKWEILLSQVDGAEKLIGGGKGFAQTLTGGMTLATDSQYLRLILEIGFIGCIFWSVMIMSILWFGVKNRKYPESMFLIMMVIGFLVMCVTHEVFMVSIQASFFWLLAGMFIGIVQKKKINEATPHY